MSLQDSDPKGKFHKPRNRCYNPRVIVSRPLTAQVAAPQDATRLKLFLRRARRLHQHLDWYAPEAWLGRRPFYFALDGERLAGALAAPPDPPDTAWLRLLAVADGVPTGDVLRALWPPARRDLERDGARLAAALAVEDWVGPALAASGFQQTNEVIVLARELDPRAPVTPSLPAGVTISEMRPTALESIGAVDRAAFAPPWRISKEALGLALAEASYVTAALVGRLPRVAGFQISTFGNGGGHLARLAVSPAYQGRGIATALTADVLAHFAARRARRVTVNTQRDNLASLRVYERLGFRRTAEHYGVWQMAL